MTAASRTLLIIEDDNELCITLELLLGKIGYAVRIARNGEEGLEIWQEDHPRAVLLDLSLPDMDGYEVCRRMKEDPKRRYTTAVLFMSGREEAEMRSNGTAVCADYYIKKPVDPNDIGVDLYVLFENDFNLEPEEIYRLRVTQRIPPNTELDPFSEEVLDLEVAPEPVAVQRPEPVSAPPPQPVSESQPAVSRSANSQSSMQLVQVKDLLQALEGSLGRTRDSLAALMNYIEKTHR